MTEREKFEEYWRKEGTFCDNPFTGKKQTAFEAWQACAESKQAELDAANAKIAELTAKSEPVAWMTRVKTTNGVHIGNLYSDTPEGRHQITGDYVCKFEIPLYTTPQVPEGWQLVPIEPTEEMIDAGVSYFQNTWCDAFTTKIHYQLMLAAAPKGK